MARNNGGSGPWDTPPGPPDHGETQASANRPDSDPWGQAGNTGAEDRQSGRKPNAEGPFGGRGPFGNGPFGSGNSDLDQLIAQAQRFARRILGGGAKNRGSGGRGNLFRGGSVLLLLGILVVLAWVGTGFYRVQPDEQGVVLRFGAYVYWTPPGLHWHLPWPIESVRLPTVTRINRTEIGYRSAPGMPQLEARRDTGNQNVLAESLMLTGDENIIDIDFTIFWRISSAPDFLFNAATPEALVRAVAESSMREVIGHTPIQPALTQARAQIESDVLKQTQEILNRYKAGIEITQVQLQRVDPPGAVIESFRDVQRANTDAERIRNEAEAYRNDIVPRARGDAARIVAEAEGAKAAAVAQSNGQAQRFDSVLKAYQLAKDVTLRRMYLDTMQDILSHGQNLIIDDKVKGFVPYLPLNSPPGTPSTPPPLPAPASSTMPSSLPTTGGGVQP